ncbi:hypothetical protein HBI56_113630 [Parastagonospora nodorum]|uniref:2EXR domain-containing protein n=1 Tax=Phaeosphaeria nodorum (strain SN15 / ATCC MYA-4574 / FGSC 10173) TaxID=321614 RepID=A0A7U2I220_PHANO|nr:hypothetical protein HBH56_194470 [Parastagonospora nodorum]QRD00456.1 hypothetical protein JI435_090210 [Parastagonospora nodorum SN15]KAH3924960.1 hypothetical protein HBH54_189040 [Parastagonospora nodorum]KAH3953051.1 hypothetical protein HBH53_041150 [Parastagonospora nodorum]KAH3976515.1 hypothetical protein HBH52_117330 [Parastagonospora nodorum]
MDTEVYFRFMDLPVELRLMIYDNLTFTTHRHLVRNPDNPSATSSGDQQSDVIGTVTMKSFPVAVLAVCKEINLEAKSIVLEKLQQLAQEPIRLFMDIGAFAECMHTSDTNMTLANALCLPIVAQRPRKCSRVEIFLKRNAQNISGSRVFMGLGKMRNSVGQSKTSCIVFSEGTIPDYYRGPGLVIPGKRVFDDVMRGVGDNGLNKRYRDSTMEVKELSDEEWAEQKKRVKLDL